MLESNEADVVLVGETFLDSSVPDSILVGASGFSVVRCDRVGRPGGGVAIFTGPRLSVSPLPSPSGIEAVSVEIAGATERLTLSYFYRPPNSGEDYLSRCCAYLSYLCARDGPLFICSDANLPGIDWGSDIASGPLARRFLARCQELGLSQVVRENTRVTGRTQSILDIVLSPCPNRVVDLCIAPPFCNSDHFAITFGISCSFLNSGNSVRCFRNFKKGNYAAITLFLKSFDWLSLFSKCHTVSQYSDLLLSALNKSIQLHVPISRIVSRPKKFPASIRRLRCRVKRAFKKRHFNPTLLSSCQSRFHKAVQKHYAALEKSILSSSDPNALFSYVKSRKGAHSAIPELVVDGAPVRDGPSKCQSFADQFATAYIVDDGCSPAFEKRTEEKLESVDFGQDEVFRYLRTCAGKMCAGPDGVPVFFLKTLRHVLAFPLSLLYSFIFQTGDMPPFFQTSSVVPVHKKGSKSDPGNYRPIAKISSLCKVMEGIVASRLLCYLESNELLSSSQYGFRPRRSVTAQMLQYVDWISRCLAEKKCCDVVYLDYSKAFDCVSHSKLLLKLEAYGISGRLLSFFRSFLANRSQRVEVGESRSLEYSVNSGVLQGSSCSGLLFLLMIQDVEECLAGTKVFMYCDDVKFVGENSIVIQDAISRLVDWCKTWQLSLSASKCAVMHFGPLNPRFQYRIGDSNLLSVDSYKDLGIDVTPSLDFSSHYKRIVSFANRRSGMMWKCFLSKSIPNLVRAFKTYTRPLLETASPVWNCWRAQDVKTLERPQRRFTSLLFYKCGLRKRSYSERCRYLGLETLESRRLLADLTFAYNQLHGNVDCPDVLKWRIPARPLKHNFRLDSEFPAPICRKFWYPNRVLYFWNT